MVRAKQRTGINPLDYMGVEPSSPNNFIIQARNPATSDYNGYNLGDEWLNSATEAVFKLVNKASNVATWTSVGGASTTITFDADSGSAVPSANVLNVVGGTNLNSVGSGNTLTLNLDAALSGITTLELDDLTVTTSLTLDFATDGVLVVNGSGVVSASSGTNGQLLISSSAGAPAWANITSSDSSLTITNGANTIDIIAAATVSEQFDTDAGSAVPSAGILQILGGTNCSTSGAGNTVTVNVDLDIADTYTADSGSAAPASSNLNILGGDNITTSAATDTVTISLDANIADTYTADAGTATPATSNINIVGAGTVTTSAAGSTVTITGASDSISLTADSGGALTGNAFTIAGGTNVTTSGAGSTITINAGAGVGSLVFIEKKTVTTSQAAIEFTSGITSTYNNYLIRYHSLANAVGERALVRLQFSDDGGSTYKTSSNYVVGNFLTSGIIFAAGSSIDHVSSGSLKMFNMTSGSGWVQTSGDSANLRTTETFPYAEGATIVIGGSYRPTPLIVNAFRIVRQDGTNLKGVFSLYGYVDS